MRPILDPKVAAAFDAFPPPVREGVLALRAVIFEVAESTDGVGEIEEALRWGQPAYLTTKSRSGSTIRLGWKSSEPEAYAVHFICTTNLVERFRTWFPDEFVFDGNRSLVCRVGDRLPNEPFRECVAAALTYHKAKRRA